MRKLGVVVAVVLAASCTSGPSGDDRASPAPPAGSPVSAAAPAQPTREPAPAASAPSALADSLGGWTRQGAVQRFGPGNLWEYINGGAEQYLSYGFQDLGSAKYTQAGAQSATVDVYRMADRLHAFGIYAQESNPKREPAAIGVEGRAGTAAVEFWAGAHYVKLVASPVGPDSKSALVALARSVAVALGAPGGMPAEVTLLPEKGLVAGSIRLVPEDGLGQAAFVGALEARYQGASSPSTLVLVPFAGPDEASLAAREYGAFLAQSGSTSRLLPALADGGFVTTERYYGHVVVARKGRWLLISLGAATESAATELLKAAAAGVAARAASSSREGQL